MEVSVQMALTMYRLGVNGNTISNIARLFGVGDESTIIRTTRRVFCAILGLENNFIYWPSNEERAELIIPSINEDLPKRVGFIDGTKIELDEAPGLDPEVYFDKDSNYSLQLQLICGNVLRIQYYILGYPGSVHDSRVWNESHMNHHHDIFFSQEEWLCADKGYGLSKVIITPFRDNSNEISDKDRNWFNKYFASRRVVIEHVNGISKETFQSLKKITLKLNSVEGHSHAVNWIKVCLIFFLILNETENGNRWYIPKYTENRQELSSEMDNQDTVDDFSASDKRMALFYFVKEKLGK